MKNRRAKIYPCTVCGTEYHAARYAKDCQQRRLIPPAFRVGERVGTQLKLWCLRCEGRLEIQKIIIARVVGPFPSDPPFKPTTAPELQLALVPPAQYAHVYRYDIDVYPTVHHSCNTVVDCERLYVVPEFKLMKIRPARRERGTRRSSSTRLHKKK